MELGDLLIGGGGGAIVLALVQALLNRRKLGADTASVLTKAAAELVQPLRERIHELEAEVDELRARVRSTVDQLDRCHDVNRAKDDLIAELTRTCRGEPS